MARTSDTLVKGILLSDYGAKVDGTLPSLTPFIATASSIVTRLREAAIGIGFLINSTDLELIERWVAAHLYCCSDQAYALEKTQSSFAKYQGETGLGLTGTKYGQTALLLDPSGLLSVIDKRKVIQVAWLGKYPSHQVDYVDKR